MADITAGDVKTLRDATGAGMMDAKKALVEADGDFDAAVKLLRERGLAKSADRSDRENAQGTVAIGIAGRVASIVELKCETDFVAKNDEFISLVQRLADAVAADGEGAIDAHKDAVDDLKVTLKENIDVGRVKRLEATGDQVLDTYLHKQEGRGVNAVIVVLDGGLQDLAHDIAVHIAFARPTYLSRDEIPADVVADERETLVGITRAEGKPEAAMDKIVEGRLNGWYKERVLLEQAYAKDDKQTIQQVLGGATLVAYAQVVIGT
jgi:elongation factor Ts